MNNLLKIFKIYLKYFKLYFLKVNLQLRDFN